MNVGESSKLTNPQDGGFGRTESAPAGRGPGDGPSRRKPGRRSRGHPSALRLRRPETGPLEPSTFLRHGPQGRTGRGPGQAMASSRRVSGPGGAGRADPGPRRRRSAGRRQRAAGDRHAALRPPDRRLGSDPWGAGDLHRPAARPAARRPAGRLPARRPADRRVAAAVPCGRTSIPAWTHWTPRVENGARLDSGAWHRS